MRISIMISVGMAVVLSLYGYCATDVGHNHSYHTENHNEHSRSH